MEKFTIILKLKKNLKLNVKFKTKSDTSILKSYIHWGPDFIKKLRGMFSIIILDNNKKKYFCFRDRLGQKPLFYSKFKGGIIISSEIKDIIFFKNKKKIKKNQNTVLKYLLRGWCDDDEKTFFNGINSFPSGSRNIDGSSIKIKNIDLEIKTIRPSIKRNLKKFFDNIKYILEQMFQSRLLFLVVLMVLYSKKSLEFKQQNNKAYSFISNNKNENDEKFIKQFLRKF